MSIAQKKPGTFEDLDLHRLPLPLVAVLDRFQEETNPFRKVNRLLDVMEVFLKLHTVAVVSDVFDGALSEQALELFGLEMLWQDEAVRAEVGACNLRKLIEAHGEEAARVREQARQAAMDLLRREDLMD